jgi:glycosyltransferase involved in cell wall biosynthesis
MRILWFTNTPSLASEKLGAKTNLGGWISSLERQISALKEIQLGVAFPYGIGKPESFSVNDTRYFTLPFAKEDGSIKGLPARWGHMIEPEEELDLYLDIIRDFQPDLIHVFGSERSYGLISARSDIPVVLQIQGNLMVSCEKWFSGISFIDILRYSRKKELLLGFGTFHDYYYFKKRALREEKILKQCKYIIGRTNWDRRITRLLAPDSIYFHCDELLRDEFYSKKWTIHLARKVTIFSTLSPVIYKGLEVILKAASLLKISSRIDFEWQVAGVSGTERIIEMIEKSQKKRFNECNIRFRGSLGANDLIEGLLNSDYYVHPSHIENSPNSVCEAMILGVPVIATYAGGTDSILQNDIEGVLVQDGDPYVLAGALLDLAGSPEKINFFSANARRKALLRHDPTTVKNNLLRIYDSVLKSS